MKKLVFATHNAHKLEELRAIIKNFEIIGLTDINCHEEIIEDADTLDGNAKIKADFVTNNFHIDCFADDTGLEVDALDGAPGVYSARYAGEGCSYQDNVNKLLEALKGVENRKARFRTVIALNINGEQHFFEGKVEGVKRVCAGNTNSLGWNLKLCESQIPSHSISDCGLILNSLIHA